MNYERLKAWVPKGRRKWCKWCSYMYLQRYKGTIRIRTGYRYNHSRVIAIWYPRGKFQFASQCYYPSIRSKLNPLMPDGYKIISHRYCSFLDTPRDDEQRAFYVRSEDRNLQPQYYGDKKPPDWIVITPSGVKTKLGESLENVKARLKKQDNERDQPRKRGRYWLRKARGIYRKPCGKPYPQKCEWRHMWPKPTTNWKGECGCEVYTKKAVSHDTIKTILDEKNATVRTAKIQIYGIEKFFTDAKAKTINKEAGYELLELDTGQAESEPTWRRGLGSTGNLVIAALRMECSTTGKVYVNTVPPQMRTVSAALDWMYDTQHYLERVGKQT